MKKEKMQNEEGRRKIRVKMEKERDYEEWN